MRLRGVCALLAIGVLALMISGCSGPGSVGFADRQKARDEFLQKIRQERLERQRLEEEKLRLAERQRMEAEKRERERLETLSSIVWDSSGGRQSSFSREGTFPDLLQRITDSRDYSLAFSQDGTAVLMDEKRWDVSSGGLRTLSSTDLPSGAVVQAPSGTHFLFFPYEEKVFDRQTRSFLIKKPAAELWDCKGEKPLHIYEGVDKSAQFRSVFSSDSKKFLISYPEGMLKLFDVKTGKFIRTFQNREYKHLSEVAFSNDAKRLAAGVVSWGLLVWDVDTGKLSRTCLDVFNDGRIGRTINALSFSPDGKQILAAGSTYVSTRGGEGVRQAGLATLIDARSGKVLKRFERDYPIEAVAFSSDGKMLAIGGGQQESSYSGKEEKGYLSLWEIGTGKLLYDFPVKEMVSAVAFSPDGRTVASSSRDGTKLWSVQAHQYRKLSSFSLLSVLVEKRLTEQLETFRELPGELTKDLERLREKKMEPPTLVKGEFEKSADFEVRKGRARVEYENSVARHNEEIGKLERRIAEYLAERSTLPQWQQNQIVEQSFFDVFGRAVVSNVRYEADTEAFFADLTSDRSSAKDFKRTIALRKAVPPAQARELKALLEKSAARVRFSFTGEEFAWAGCDLVVGAETYAATLMDKGYRPSQVATSMSSPTNTQSISLDELKAKSPGAVSPVSFSEDPEIARLSKLLMAERQKKANRQAQKAEVARLEAELADLLATRGGDSVPGELYRKLLAGLPRSGKETNGVAVIIGNRDYATHHPDLPNVKYAQNDAKAMKEYVTKTLGYPEQQVFVIEDATKAELESQLGSATNVHGWLKRRVKPGETEVLVYYSGHGMPGLESGKVFLAPVNADPNMIEVTGYSLDVLYRNLDALQAKKTTVVIDACFSGGSGAGAVIQNASSIGVRVKPPQSKSSSALVLTAAGPDQVASWDDEARMGLMTRHFIEGATGVADRDHDGRVTAQEMDRYLSDEVAERARSIYGRYQSPQASGPLDRILSVLR